MAWIKVIAEDEARGEVRQLYQQIKKQMGGVPNILNINSLHPPSMAAHQQYFVTLMYSRSPLSRARREMVALTVSAQNRCRY